MPMQVQKSLFFTKHRQPYVITKSNALSLRGSIFPSVFTNSISSLFKNSIALFISSKLNVLVTSFSSPNFSIILGTIKNKETKDLTPEDIINFTNGFI